MDSFLLYNKSNLCLNSYLNYIETTNSDAHLATASNAL